MTINILCVEDDESWRRILSNHFKYEVNGSLAKADIAEEYSSAMEKIKRTKYDLIILDSLEGDCFRIHEDIKNIPQGDVIIFSTNLRIKDKAKELGIPYYSKDEGMDELREVIAKYSQAQ